MMQSLIIAIYPILKGEFQLSFVQIGMITLTYQICASLLQPAIEAHAPHWLWDPVTLTILNAPTWLALGVLGAILILLGRKKKPLIGYSRD